MRHDPKTEGHTPLPEMSHTESDSRDSTAQPEAAEALTPPIAVPQDAPGSQDDQECVPSEMDPPPTSEDDLPIGADSDDLDTPRAIDGSENQRPVPPTESPNIDDSPDMPDTESTDQSLGDHVADPSETTLTPQPEPILQLLELALGIKDQISDFHSRTEFQEDIIRRMQKQIEDLRADQIRSLLKPVVVSLAELHAHVGQLYSLDSQDSERIHKEIGLFAHQVEEAIEHLGFDSLNVAVGDRFDAEVHTAERTTVTEDSALDRCIAKVRRQGFTASEDAKPILYARVDVYRYEADHSSETPGFDSDMSAAGPDQIVLQADLVPPTTEDSP